MARLSQTFKFISGDRVKLSEEGRRRWGTCRYQGGEDGIGVVDFNSEGDRGRDDDFPYRVEWDNNEFNSYREVDLVKIGTGSKNGGKNHIDDDQN